MTKLKHLVSESRYDELIGSLSMRDLLKALEKMGVTTFDELMRTSSSIIHGLNTLPSSSVNHLLQPSSSHKYCLSDLIQLKSILSEAYLRSRSHKPFVETNTSIFDDLLLDHQPAPPRQGSQADAYIRYYSTGNDRLNELLRGGYPSNRIIELQGRSNVGKTILASAVVSATIASRQYSYRALYIDTSKSFSIRVVTDFILTSLTVDLLRESPADTHISLHERISQRYNECIPRLEVAYVENIWELLDLLTKVAQELPIRYNVIVIDSLYNLLAALISPTNSSTTRASLTRSSTTLPSTTGLSETRVSIPLMSMARYIDHLLSNITILCKAIARDLVTRPSIIFTTPTDVMKVALSSNPASTLKSQRLFEHLFYAELFDLSLHLSPEFIPSPAMASSQSNPNSQLHGIYSQPAGSQSEGDPMIPVTKIGESGFDLVILSLMMLMFM
jgi:KaiC/GvpD/RAD55 family RecA-like ATPase